MAAGAAVSIAEMASLAAMTPRTARASTIRRHAAKTGDECKNCGAAEAPLYCMACAAALCGACSECIHGSAAMARIMSGHKPRPREEAAFDMLVARLGGDLPCVSEALQAMMPVGGLLTAAERVVQNGLKKAASFILADDESIRTRLLPDCGTPSVDEFGDVLHDMGDRGLVVAYRALAMRRRLASHVAVVTGPFPVVITTNWDELLEAGFRSLRYCEDQITCPGRTVEYIHGRQGEALPVRFRKDVAQLYAEIKSGLQPARYGDKGARLLRFSTIDVVMETPNVVDCMRAADSGSCTATSLRAAATSSCAATRTTASSLQATLGARTC